MSLPVLYLPLVTQVLSFERLEEFSNKDIGVDSPFAEEKFSKYP